jgi:hypothetical protein
MTRQSVAVAAFSGQDSRIIPPGAAANADRQSPALVEHIVINIQGRLAAATSGGTIS